MCTSAAILLACSLTIDWNLTIFLRAQDSDKCIKKVPDDSDGCFPWFGEMLSSLPSRDNIHRAMMTSSNGDISSLLAFCARNSPVPGEFPSQRPVTRSFDVSFDLRLNTRLCKQSWGWWFKTPPRPLWRHRNATYESLDIIAKWLLTNGHYCEMNKN